jgi:NAD(P)H-quinone oxidoreductase subunit 5
MSPLVALEPATLITLAFIGGFTASFAGVVMMAQSSVKRSLAYSTVAQMGFMMLQCGLGAFSAAMLHILAHSLYKAYAFLNSGSVVSQSLAVGQSKAPTNGLGATAACLAAAAATTLVAYFTIGYAAGIDIGAKAGGLVLAFILCLALTTWGWRVFSLGRTAATITGLVGLVGLCLTYLLSYFAVDHLVSATIPAVRLPATVELVLLGLAMTFAALMALYALARKLGSPSWLIPLRVHAANGFYVDALYHRLFSPLVKS